MNPVARHMLRGFGLCALVGVLWLSNALGAVSNLIFFALCVAVAVLGFRFKLQFLRDSRRLADEANLKLVDDYRRRRALKHKL